LKSNRGPIACGLLAAALLLPPLAVAQDVTAPALKAAFIYNFLKFTEWPAVTPVSDPFVICVMGDAPVGDALERLVQGRELAGRPMTVSLAVSSPPAMACRVLYVSGATEAEAARTIAGLLDSPVLTISDVVGFTNRGGIAQFFFEHGRLHFIIKVEAVKRSGLKMSSALLALGQR
jgi:hypothetical protein